MTCVYVFAKLCERCYPVCLLDCTIPRLPASFPFSLSRSNGIVYVGADSSFLVALSSTTGALLWTFNTNGKVQSSPSLSPDGSLVLFGVWKKHCCLLHCFLPFASAQLLCTAIQAADKTLYAVNAATGASVWNWTTVGVLYSSPCVGPNAIYIGSEVLALFRACVWSASPTSLDLICRTYGFSRYP